MLKTFFNQTVLPRSIQADLEAVNELIQKELTSKASLTTEVAHHIIHAGGKRVRPLLVLLTARAFGYQGEHHQLLATMIEFIHTASLLHDDVVDEATLRRGVISANRVFGNAASVLVGDFLHTRAFELMLAVNHIDVMHVVAKTTNEIAEGEVLQLMHRHEITLTEEVYMTIIRAKTAKLFEAAAHIGAILGTNDPKALEASKIFGDALGCAFQLIDDYLDYAARDKAWGKTIGQDLKESKMTLPLIAFMKEASTLDKECIIDYICNGKNVHFDAIFKAVCDSSALTRVAEQAAFFAQKAVAALEKFPQNEYTMYLKTVCQFVVNRQF